MGDSRWSYIDPAELRDSILTKSPGIIVIDVRDDDYVGGHVKGSVNVPSSRELWSAENEDERKLWVSRILSENTTIIFHCQQSQQRGPKCARIFADSVAQANLDQAPSIRVLRGGFSQWHASYADDDQAHLLIQK